MFTPVALKQPFPGLQWSLSLKETTLGWLDPIHRIGIAFFKVNLALTAPTHRLLQKGRFLERWTQQQDHSIANCIGVLPWLKIERDGPAPPVRPSASSSASSCKVRTVVDMQMHHHATGSTAVIIQIAFADAYKVFLKSLPTL